MGTRGTIYNIQRLSTHDGPGVRTTVFFKGCPLHCLWCSNPESQDCAPQPMYFADLCSGCGQCAARCSHEAVIRHEHTFGRDFSRCVRCGECIAHCPTTACTMSGAVRSVEEVMQIVRKDASFYFRSGGGVTFGGGECTMQGAFLMALIEACAAEGYHICLDTCGQTEPGLFENLLGKADLFLFDVKHMDSAKHRELTGRGNELIQQNLRTALATCPEKLRLRVPLMPGLNDDEENIAAMADLLHGFGVHSVDVLPCHFFGRNKYEALGLPHPEVREYVAEELHAVLEIFARCNLETEIV